MLNLLINFSILVSYLILAIIYVFMSFTAIMILLIPIFFILSFIFAGLAIINYGPKEEK